VTGHCKRIKDNPVAGGSETTARPMSGGTVAGCGQSGVSVGAAAGHKCRIRQDGGSAERSVNNAVLGVVTE
jgi:hypothetical protein